MFEVIIGFYKFFFCGGGCDCCWYYFGQFLYGGVGLWLRDWVDVGLDWLVFCVFCCWRCVGVVVDGLVCG